MNLSKNNVRIFISKKNTYLDDDDFECAKAKCPHCNEDVDVILRDGVHVWSDVCTECYGMFDVEVKEKEIVDL